MTENSEVPASDLFAADVVGDGPETGAIVSTQTIRARDLSDDHVGKFIGFQTEFLNYTAKILRVQHFSEGNKPGVSVWLRMSALPDGTPDRNERMHVPFDSEIELVEMLPY